MDNADLLTNAAAALEKFKRERDMLRTEIDAKVSRLETLEEVIDALEAPQRRRQRRSRTGEPPLLPDMQPADYLVVPEPAS